MDKLYDFTSLEEVCGGDQDFMNQMIGMFKTNIPKEVELIKSAVQSNDLDEVKRITHKMKPSIGYVCASVMSSEVKAIEEWSGGSDELVTMVDGFLVHVRELLIQLEEL